MVAGQVGFSMYLRIKPGTRDPVTSQGLHLEASTFRVPWSRRRDRHRAVAAFATNNNEAALSGHHQLVRRACTFAEELLIIRVEKSGLLSPLAFASNIVGRRGDAAETSLLAFPAGFHTTRAHAAGSEEMRVIACTSILALASASGPDAFTVQGRPMYRRSKLIGTPNGSPHSVSRLQVQSHCSRAYTCQYFCGHARYTWETWRSSGSKDD